MMASQFEVIELSDLPKSEKREGPQDDECYCGEKNCKCVELIKNTEPLKITEENQESYMVFKEKMKNVCDVHMNSSEMRKIVYYHFHKKATPFFKRNVKTFRVRKMFAK